MIDKCGNYEVTINNNIKVDSPLSFSINSNDKQINVFDIITH